MKMPKVRYVVAWYPAAEHTLVVSVVQQNVGVEEGWFLIKVDDKGRQAFLSGPHETPEGALRATDSASVTQEKNP